MMRRKSAIAVFCVMSATISELAAREWTDSSGKFRVEADLLDFGHGQVGLKRADGTVIRVPLERLSRADQAAVTARWPDAWAMAREWTDSSGKFRVEAELLDLKHGQVGLKRAGGVVIRVPLERLSRADQAFVTARWPDAQTALPRTATAHDSESFEMEPIPPEDAQTGNRQPSKYSIDIGIHNGLTNKSVAVNHEAYSTLVMFSWQLDLSEASDRAKLVKRFVETFGLEEATWRGIQVYQNGIRAFRWPPKTMQAAPQKRPRDYTEGGAEVTQAEPGGDLVEIGVCAIGPNDIQLELSLEGKERKILIPRSSNPDSDRSGPIVRLQLKRGIWTGMWPTSKGFSIGFFEVERKQIWAFDPRDGQRGVVEEKE